MARAMAREPLVVDNSILSAVAKCATLAFVRYALGLNTREESLALGAGSSIHLGLQRWLEGHKDPVQVMAEDYERRVERYLKIVERTALGKDDKRFEPAWVEAIFQQYLDRYEGRWPFKVVQHTAEKPISAPFPIELKSGRKVIYVARLDAIVRKWESGGKWLLDHKTTRKVSDWWIDKQKVSSQFTGQLWLAREMGVVKEAEGVLLNAIEIPEPHRSDKVCPQHKISYQECSIRHAGGTFVYVTRHAQEMEAWFDTASTLIRRYERLLDLAAEAGIQGIPEVDMQGRFNEGCVFCSNKDWCRLGRNTSKSAVKSNFVLDEWNPLAA